MGTACRGYDGISIFRFGNLFNFFPPFLSFYIYCFFFFVIVVVNSVSFNFQGRTVDVRHA